ncbi:MAG: hypothetical protein QXW97_04235 [Candidatus Pacearchaeota archaeon]
MNYKKKFSQVSIEYLVIIGFVSIILIAILGIAFFYSNGIKDRIKITQVNNFANKIISSSESVYYYGEPSKTTISVYLPEGVENIEINNNEIIISTRISSGLEKTSFKSNVPLTGSISKSSGIKNIVITAEQNKTRINSSS